MSIFEIGMLVGFGFAWPSNIYKSIKSRTAAGRSILFQFAVLAGYICGITSKLILGFGNFKWYVLFFYVLNLIMVGTDLILYIRNKRIDAAREKGE